MTGQPSPIAVRLSAAALPLIMNSPLVTSWREVSQAVNASLEPSLVQLVEIRASQINGCANCINMHAKEARWDGESEQRLYLLSAWREAPCYSERERAALGWTEALMRLSEGHQVEAAHAALKPQFTEEEQVKLTLAVVAINGWNLIAVRVRSVRGPGAAGAGGRLMSRRQGATVAARCGARLIRVAYRMLGSVADAEDVVQEAFIRWMRADQADVQARGGLPAPHGDAVVPRSAQVGPAAARNLHRPLAPRPGRRRGSRGRHHATIDARAGTTLAARTGLFLLHDVFGVAFEEVAVTIRRDPAACRQLASRARMHVRKARPRSR